MAKHAKYATAEERREAVAAKMRAKWRDPAMRNRWKRSMSAAAHARNDDRLSDETLALLLLEYVERDPTDMKVWRYTIEELSRRYLISPTYIPHLVMKHGAKRRERMRKLGPAKVKTIVHRFVVLGHSVRALSIAMGVSDAAIRYRLKMAGIGIDMRGTGAPPERMAA